MLRFALPCLLASAAMLAAAGCKDTTGPAWPPGARLAAERPGPGAAVELTWPAASDDRAVAGYELSVDGAAPVALGPDQTRHAFDGLADAAEHAFVLRARDEAANWSAGLEGSVTIPDLTPPTWPVERFDARELDRAGEDLAFELSWEPASDAVALKGYLLTRSGSGFKAELGPAARSHTVEGREIEGVYSLRALDAAGNASAPLTCEVRSRRKLERLIAKNSDLLGALEADSGGLADVLARGGLDEGGDGLADLQGMAVADSGGFGGLGTIGSGGGVGGLGSRAAPPKRVPGRVRIEPASSPDGLDAAAARRAVEALRGALQACYEKRLEHDPAIGGSLKVRLIFSAGRASRVESSGGSLQDAGTRSCAERVLKRTRLPGADGSVSLELTFQAG